MQGAKGPPSVGEGTGRVVLLFDRDEEHRAFARDVLERAGYAVVLAVHATAVRELFFGTRSRVDAAVLDCPDPVLDGRETVLRLRRARPDLPIILCAPPDGSEQSETVLQGLGIPVLRKPLRPLQLVDTVGRLLRA